jgi:hypothetical protein
MIFLYGIMCITGVKGGRKAMRAQEGAAAGVPTNETRGRATPRVGAGTVDLSCADRIQVPLLPTRDEFLRV